MENLRSFKHSAHSVACSSQRDVSYSCGFCGYELNLCSSDRNISTIGSKYGKSIKRGIISFVQIDENRFTLIEEVQCIPYLSTISWGLFRRRTRLHCRKCGNHIGNACNDSTSSYTHPSDISDSTNEVPVRRKYDIRIRALQPSSAEESGAPLFI